MTPPTDISTEERKLLDTVDALSDDIFALTAALVREPSTLGNEQGVLAVMEEAMSSRGWSPRRVPMDTARLAEHPAHAPTPWDDDPATRHNLAAVIPGQGGGPGRGQILPVQRPPGRGQPRTPGPLEPRPLRAPGPGRLDVRSRL